MLKSFQSCLGVSRYPPWLCVSFQTAAEQEKKQSQIETEKQWGAPVQYGTTKIQVR